MFQPKAVVIHPQPEDLANHHEHDGIKKNGKGIALKCALVREIAQPTRPTRNHEYDEQCQAQRKFSDP